MKTQRILTKNELECMTNVELVEFFKSRRAGEDRNIAGLLLLDRAEKQTGHTPHTILQALTLLDYTD